MEESLEVKPTELSPLDKEMQSCRELILRYREEMARSLILPPELLGVSRSKIVNSDKG
jgi:hypothetical protein